MKEVDFSNFNPDNKGKGNGITFLRFERDKTYKIRPFGSAVEFYKIFIAKGKPSIIVDGGDKDQAVKLLSEHTGTELRPSYRNAMFIIDRADGRVRILEGGFQIFEQFGNWSESSGIKPGSGQGGDWSIKVEGDGVGGSNPRKYHTVYLGPSAFSEEEKQMISKLKEEGKLKLANYLKETSLDKVVETAFGGGTSTEPAPQETAVGAAAGTSDDDMDW
ncbi:MAG: hypothetical protein ACXAC5_00535 [Promethearchaeota archaeon]|jgi:hypothetical protein